MKKLEQLKTFEGACKVEGLDPKKVIPSFSNYPSKDRTAMIAHAKLVIIARAANRIANGGKEWRPDFSNSSQWKYTPYFYHEPGGSSGFRFHDFGWLGFGFGRRLSPLLYLKGSGRARREDVHQVV